MHNAVYVADSVVDDLMRVSPLRDPYTINSASV